MPGSVMSWFKDASDGDRVDLLRAVLAAVDRMDPGLVRASDMWRRGKTARLAATLPLISMEEVGIHLSVEDADKDLLRTLRGRVREGRLSFVRGRTNPTPPDAGEAFVAQLGTGSLLVQERRGEVVITASKLRALPVPEDLAEGRPLPFKLADDGEGFVLLLFEGQPIIVAAYSDLRPREIRAVRRDPIELGLIRVSPSLLILAVKAPHLIEGWADMPFALAIEPVERRRLVPPSPSGGAILLAAVDRQTGRVAVIRSLRMPKDWYRALETLLEEQHDGAAAYDMARYRAEIAAFRTRWPDPRGLHPGMMDALARAEPDPA